jgi:hypothetical protein
MKLKKEKKENIPLTSVEEARVYFYYIYKHWNVETIASNCGIAAKQVKRAIQRIDKKYPSERTKLSLKERLDLLDQDELESAERLYYIQKLAQEKMLEYLVDKETSTKEIVFSYKMIPSLLELQKLQRVISERPTSITFSKSEKNMNDTGESAKSIAELLETKEDEIALATKDNS